jgi:small-conductance mechanosensitive channel
MVLETLREWWLTLPTWLGILVLFSGAILAGLAVEKSIVAWLRHWAKRSVWKFDDVLVEAAHPSISVVLFVTFVWLSLRYVPLELSEFSRSAIDNASLTILILSSALFLVRAIRGLLHLRAQEEKRWAKVSIVGSRMGALIIYAVAFLVIIHQYGLEITPILTTMGLAGLAVALALQDTLANLFAGIWIQTQNAMAPGHYVRLEDQKLEGYVVEVGWRTTKIRTLQGNLIVVPNQTVAKATITDFFLPDPRMSTSLSIQTGYEADPERVVPMLIEEAMAAADEVPFILRDPPPRARLNRSADSGWEFWMSFWVDSYQSQWNAQGHVLNRVRKRFLKEGVRIPYPTREHYAVPPMRLDVAPMEVPEPPVDAPRFAVGVGERTPDGKGVAKPVR